ncbi:MAG: bifunctional oligoribonuclease/PAP phosphatase NrnA [Candidatus Omnitrophica bacterium]|nr:bifunctional oligoribonuclease/PAP phosphatase NrnA [Candidatus Omnitrophota bacterium]
MENRKNFKNVKKEILAAESIAIFSHINPDGDTIGSMLALGLGLKSLGKKVIMLNADMIPKVYQTLPGAKSIKKTLKKKNIDLAVAVDCGKGSLLGKNLTDFKNVKKSIAIDHHRIRNKFAQISLVDTEASATGEIVYYLLKNLNINITKDISENILTSIIVETNSFRLPSTQSKTFAICAELLKTGINFAKISEIVYWSKSKQAMLLWSLCIKRMKFLNNDKIVWSIVRKRDFKKFSANDEDVDSFPNEMLSIKGVQIVIFFREKDNNQLRVSLRSKGKANVALLASRFEGGGHLDIAGFYISNSDQSIKRVIQEAEKIIK